MAKPDYDTSIARMAGNIAAGLVSRADYELLWAGSIPIVVEHTVKLARAIVAEIRVTEPKV